MTTTSPGPVSMVRWVPLAMRERAAMGSPWEPVVRTAMSPSGTRLITRDLDVADHRATRDADEALVLLCGLHHLLNAVDVRGEGGDDDPTLRLFEDLVEGVADDALGGYVAGPLAVGRVAEIGEHALFPQRGEPP